MPYNPIKVLSVFAMSLLITSCGSDNIAEYTNPEQIAACASINNTLDTILEHNKDNHQLIHAMMIRTTEHDCVNELNRIIQTGMDVNYVQGSQTVLDLAIRNQATQSITYLSGKGAIAKYEMAQANRDKQMKADRQERQAEQEAKKEKEKKDFLSNKSLSKKDKSINSDEIKKAAEQGDVNAQYNLGTMYDEGNGVKKDPSEAFKWYKKAAEQGDVDAQYNVAAMYTEGVGVNKDQSEAIKWFKKAAEQGDVDAQYTLAHIYFDGNGVKKDNVKAVRLFESAGAQGHREAQEWAKRIKATLKSHYEEKYNIPAARQPDAAQRYAEQINSKIMSGGACGLIQQNIDMLANTSHPVNARIRQIDALFDRAYSAGCVM